MSTEPTLRVGLATGRHHARLTLHGSHTLLVDGRDLGPAPEQVELRAQDGALSLGAHRGERIVMLPQDPDASFVLHDMTVGLSFHWEHDEDLVFRGAASIELRPDGGFDVVNEVGLEDYLQSVVSSEMAATCPRGLLEAHAIISRSWLLAQLAGGASPQRPPVPSADRVVRWYDREDHEHFDVCADDHCQRYQGITRAHTAQARAAVQATRGVVLTYGGRVCDARFSKSCGGMTELFSSAWGDQDVPYLQAFPDRAGPADFALPLTDEAHATAFIEGAPDAWCKAADPDLLARILPKLDHDTDNFYRWQVHVSAAQVRAWVREKLGLDVGPVRALRPLQRGPSGRLVRLAIEGEARTIQVGKELEIRRVLSDSHLYSSAFVVHPEGDGFDLRGAGWGHGVGLCQIGAAVMADQGAGHEEILAHYYRGAVLRGGYGRG